MIMKCIENHYTLREECHGQKTCTAHPAKFSPDDRYGKYRRLAMSKN